jgi:uncharacterized protein YegL
MASLKEFTVSSPRPLPVVVLADVSGSMGQDGKIQALNGAVQEMLSSFSEEEDVQAQIQVAVITFGQEGARLHLPLTPASSAKWQEMPAAGKTPMGAAFEQARELIEDRSRIPGRAYRPTLVLVSDGVPTDDWQPALQRLLTSERASKAERLAMAIGAEADNEVLQAFVAGSTTQRVFRGDEGRQIRQFFRLVTLSVSSRSRHVNPNAPPPEAPTDLDDLV